MSKEKVITESRIRLWDIRSITTRVRYGSIGGWQTLEGMDVNIKGEYALIPHDDDFSFLKLEVGDVIILKRRKDLTDKRLRVIQKKGYELQVKDEWWERNEDKWKKYV